MTFRSEGCLNCPWLWAGIDSVLCRINPLRQRNPSAGGKQKTRGGGRWTPEAAGPGGCWPSPAARTQGPRPAPLPGLRLCVCARGRRSQCLWSGVCTSRLRDSRAPGPPDLATVVLPSGLVPRSSSPDSAAPRKPPGSCFPPPQRFPSAAPSPLPRGARAPPGALTSPGWARAPGTCAAGRGWFSAGDRPLTYGHVCPLCPTWAGTGSQGSGAPRRRWGGREGRGERWRDKETQRKRTEGQGRGRAGSQRLSPSEASRPLLPCRGPCWEQPWEAGCAAGTRAGPSLAPCAHLQVDSAVVRVAPGGSH